MAFATAYRTSRGAVVGFLTDDTATPTSLAAGEVEVTPLSWIAQPDVTPTEAVDRLVDDVRKWLSAPVEPGAVGP